MIFDKVFDAVQEPVEVSDGAGGTTTTYSNVATNVPGALNKRSNLAKQKELVGDVTRIQYDRIIGLSKSVSTIEAGYLIIDGDDEYEVVDPKEEVTTWVLAVMKK